MQRGAGRKSPTIPAGRRKKGALVTGLARNTSAIVLMPSVVCRSLNYGWDEVGRKDQVGWLSAATSVHLVVCGGCLWFGGANPMQGHEDGGKEGPLG